MYLVRLREGGEREDGISLIRLYWDERGSFLTLTLMEGFVYEKGLDIFSSSLGEGETVVAFQ